MKTRAINLDGTLIQPSLVGVMVLLDRSGSMASVRTAMTEAFDGFVLEQRAENPNGLWLTLDQFDTTGPHQYSEMAYETIYERMPIADVGRLQLQPRGWTPLSDALVQFAKRAKAILADTTDQTERLLLVVISDGKENASTQHTAAEVKALLDGLKSDDCEVIWLGTQESAMEAAAQDYTVPDAMLTWKPTAQGVNYASGGLRAAATSYRSGGSAVVATANYVGENVAHKGAAEDWRQITTLEELRQKTAKLRHGA